MIETKWKIIWMPFGLAINVLDTLIPIIYVMVESENTEAAAAI